VPHHSFSLWNNYRLHPRLAVALGIVRRSDMFAAIDNTVVLPEYTRADLATYVTLRNGLRLQANIDNLFDANYFVNADNNTNISPGSPRTLRIALLAAF
jgi:catecholate siderophore receptor